MEKGTRNSPLSQTLELDVLLTCALQANLSIQRDVGILPHSGYPLLVQCKETSPLLNTFRLSRKSLVHQLLFLFCCLSHIGSSGHQLPQTNLINRVHVMTKPWQRHWNVEIIKC